MTVWEYLQAPCSKLATAHWKAATIAVPADMRMVHDCQFEAQMLDRYTDTVYFRLFHDLDVSDSAGLEQYVTQTADLGDMDTIVSIINRSYVDLQVSKAQLLKYRTTPAYQSDLWILVKEKKTGVYAGCGIADFDPQTKELILEWIQVLPEYRRQKLGSLIVSELLHRGRKYADFATVSGKANNPARPERLYRKCGFVGQDIWHVLQKKRG